MGKLPAWLRERLREPNEPRVGGEFHRDPSALCQSWNTVMWRGRPCGNDAKYRIGPEVACHAHVGQACGRHPGVVPVAIEARKDG